MQGCCGHEGMWATYSILMVVIVSTISSPVTNRNDKCSIDRERDQEYFNFPVSIISPCNSTMYSERLIEQCRILYEGDFLSALKNLCPIEKLGITHMFRPKRDTSLQIPESTETQLLYKTIREVSESSNTLPGSQIPNRDETADMKRILTALMDGVDTLQKSETKKPVSESLLDIFEIDDMSCGSSCIEQCGVLETCRMSKDKDTVRLTIRASRDAESQSEPDSPLLNPVDPKPSSVKVPTDSCGIKNPNPVVVKTPNWMDQEDEATLPPIDNIVEENIADPDAFQNAGEGRAFPRFNQAFPNVDLGRAPGGGGDNPPSISNVLLWRTLALIRSGQRYSQRILTALNGLFQRDISVVQQNDAAGLARARELTRDTYIVENISTQMNDGRLLVRADPEREFPDPVVGIRTTIEQHVGRLNSLQALVGRREMEQSAANTMRQIRSRHRDYIQTLGTQPHANIVHGDYDGSFPKVETHLHAAAGLFDGDFCAFFGPMARRHGDEVVYNAGGAPLTLNQLIGLAAHDLNTDSSTLLSRCPHFIHTRADNTLFNNFPAFEAKFNIFENAMLREVFLKYSNDVDGFFFAEMLKVIQKVYKRSLEQNHQFAEVRLSLKCNNQDEWFTLADFLASNDLFSNNIQYVIQIKKNIRLDGERRTVDDVIKNLFYGPMVAARFPRWYPNLTELMSHVSAIDTVGDEAFRSINYGNVLPRPSVATGSVPAWYLNYYIDANLITLNTFRRANGQRVIEFRPHAGETAGLDNLISAFLLSPTVAHGTELDLSPSLTLLYYLAQVGLSTSPESNDKLYRHHQDQHFNEMRKMGLAITLTTDDPLIFSRSSDSLTELYTDQTGLWALTRIEYDELLSTAITISGFPLPIKRRMHAGYSDNGESWINPVTHPAQRALQNRRNMILAETITRFVV